VLKPGQFATCRPDVDKLMLWTSYDCEIDDVNDTVTGEELFIILDVMEMSNCADPLTNEWEKGAYKVLSPRGICGWVGAGWVIPA